MQIEVLKRTENPVTLPRQSNCFWQLCEKGLLITALMLLIGIDDEVQQPNDLANVRAGLLNGQPTWPDKVPARETPTVLSPGLDHVMSVNTIYNQWKGWIRIQMNHVQNSVLLFVEISI